MDYKKVFWGILFILIGVLFVLKNLSILDFSWYQFLNLWPLLLILWGVSMLPVKGFVKLILSLAIVVLGVWIVNKFERVHWFDFHSPRSYEYRDNRTEEHDSWRKHDKEVERESTDLESQYLFFPYSPDISKVNLKLDAAAGTFYLQSTTEELIEVEKEGNIGTYSLTSQEGSDAQIVRLSMEEASIQGERLRHRVDIKLHEKPVWDLDLDIGAARVEMDLTPFKAGKIDIDGGASSIRLKIGDLHPDVNVEVDAGASSIYIEVPESSGCLVKTSSVLSGKDLRNFIKKDNGRYETENFEESTNKVNIKVDVAVSKIEVKRY